MVTCNVTLPLALVNKVIEAHGGDVVGITEEQIIERALTYALDHEEGWCPVTMLTPEGRIPVRSF